MCWRRRQGRRRELCEIRPCFAQRLDLFDVIVGAIRPNLTQQPPIFRSALEGAKNRGTDDLWGMSPKFEGCSTPSSEWGHVRYRADRFRSLRRGSVRAVGRAAQVWGARSQYRAGVSHRGGELLHLDSEVGWRASFSSTRGQEVQVASDSRESTLAATTAIAGNTSL